MSVRLREKEGIGERLCSACASLGAHASARNESNCRWIWYVVLPSDVSTSIMKRFVV